MTGPSLILPTAIREQLIAHAKSLAPIESCGYLGGRDAKVLTFYPMTNVDNSPEHFSFDPKEQFKVVKEARNSGETLLAVYHSHPKTPARLSEEDVRLFNDPNIIYIIVSLAEDLPSIQGYTVKKPSDTEIEVSRVTLSE